MLRWCDDSDIDLDYTHLLKGVFTIMPPLSMSLSLLNVTVDDVLINATFSRLSALYNMWRAGDLRKLCHAHNIATVNRDTASSLHAKLLLHSCVDDCPVLIHIFTTLRARRGSQEVDRRRA